MAANLELLARLGFRPGHEDRWCASCERTFKGERCSFKCKRCAEKDVRLIHVDELSFEGSHGRNRR